MICSKFRIPKMQYKHFITKTMAHTIKNTCSHTHSPYYEQKYQINSYK